MAFKLQHPEATLNDKQIETAMARILKPCNRPVPDSAEPMKTGPFFIHQFRSLTFTIV